MFARARRTRTLLAAVGIFAASLVVGTAATVGYGLATGFDRAAREADLPDVIARFDQESRETVDERVRALPNLAARSYRHEKKNVELRANGHDTRKGVLHIVVGGRRGYAVTDGRDLRGPDEVVVERGLAREWGLAPGDRMDVFGGWRVRIVGVAVEPDNVAFPLTVTPRVYTSEASWDHPVSVNLALLWLVDPGRADITLTQARATSFGIGNLAFITRAGIEVLLGQAAGIVISLLVAFSLVALVAAGTMLAASAHAEVQRRLPTFGVRRALGFTPGRLAAGQAAEAALLAAPAAALGLGAGALAVAGPSGALLAQLNELPPGAALLPVLAVCLVAITALVTTAATWPAWRAARRPPAEILRGGDLARPRRRRNATGLTPRAALDGLLATGARFAVAARGRFAASVATIAVCAGVVTLMLALASLLERLRDDPGTIGKRYQLTVRLNPFDVDAVRAIPGVADAAERYQADVADSFRLGEPLRMIAYPGDHTRFEAPPLAEGRRLRSDGEAEVGVGLADALGLRPGAMFAVQTEGGTEARFRVVGVVRALEHDGRIAYVRPRRLLDAQPGVGSTISVRLAPGADRAAVERDAGGARRAAAAGRRRDDPQRRVPRRARDRAARGRARGRARLPVRADPGARDDRPRAPRRRRAAPRGRRRRAHGRDGARRRRAGRGRPGGARRRAARVARAGAARRPAGGRLRRPPARAVGGPGRARARRPARALRRRDRARGPPHDARARDRGAARGMRRATALAAVAAALLVTSCGGDGEPTGPAASTLEATLVDRDGDGALERGPGEPLARPHGARAGRADRRGARDRRADHRHARARRGVARAGAVPRPPRRRVLLDVPPAGGAQHAGARRRRARGQPPAPRRGLVTGDIVDSNAATELDQALAVLDGGAVGSRTPARPATTACRRRTTPTRSTTAPTWTRRATPASSPRPSAAFRSPGLTAPWYPALGNHDLLVQGETPATPRIDAVATGSRMVVGLDPGLRPQRGRRQRRGPSTRCWPPARPAAASRSRPTRSAASCRPPR